MRELPRWMRPCRRRGDGCVDDLAAKAVAFYLPQFHPIPENDAWWGPGFTEWTNAAKARPLFPGHRQPHLPADLGFYDLRLPRRERPRPRSRRSTASRRSATGTTGSGRPPDPGDALHGGAGQRRADFSFCLGWANQTWTGIWHGAADRVLIEQTYPGPEDDQAHFDAIVAAFRDQRYLRVDGRPVFYVFRPEELPDAAQFVDRWQQMARQAGLDGLYLVAESAICSGAGRSTPGHGGRLRLRGVHPAPGPDRAADVAAMRARRKLLRGLEVYRYAREACRSPPASTPTTTCRPCTPTGTTRPARVAAASRSRLVAGEVPASRPRRHRHAVSPAGRRAAALDQVVERVGRGQPPRARPASTATAGCEVLAEELRRGR